MESPSINLMENLNPAISFAISGDVSLLQLKNISEKKDPPKDHEEHKNEEGCF